MSLLVTPEWVAGRLQQPGIVLLDATLPPVGVTPPPDVRSRYLAQHLPGAVFFDIERLSDKTTSLPHMLPTAENFARSMAELGIADTMTIVVYEQANVFSAPRAWWMLRTFGAQHVHVLDGGLQAWTQAGLPTEAGPVQRSATTFHASLQADAVQDFAQLQGALANHDTVLDARSFGRFSGTSPEPRAGLHAGHMPGATNMPYTDLVQANRFKTIDELRAVFAEKNVNLQQPITTTCGSGITAAVIALGLEICGAKHIRLYDGSWAEYAQHPEAIIHGSFTSTAR
ncbi:MAG: 3-mercaptopyruvate sulfurtransferase [Janthinobacterium lividum]